MSHINHNLHRQVLKTKEKTENKQINPTNYCNIKSSNKVSSADTLKAREDAYRKRNAELQAKTSTLVQEAQDILLKQTEDKTIQILQLPKNENMKSHSIPDTHVTKSSFDFSDRASPVTAISNIRKAADKLDTGLLDFSDHESMIEGIKDNLNLSDAIRRVEEKLLRDENTDFEENVNESCSKDDQLEDALLHEKQEPTIAAQKSKNTAAVSLSKSTLRNMVPSEELGSEAMQRFLKAKLNVVQEELDHTSEELAQREIELQQANKELIDRQEQQQGLNKQVSTLRGQNEKQKSRIQELTKQLDASQIEASSLKRDFDVFQRQSKKSETAQSTIEVRLTRALEEVEKHKAHVQQIRNERKDKEGAQTKKLEELESENRQLQKQKSELIAGFKKQMELIDNLKRQKMHIEAARMLNFREDEFMKVLDWWKLDK